MSDRAHLPGNREDGDLLSLIAAYCDSTATQEECTQLESRLRGNPQAQAVYLNYARVHAALQLRSHRGPLMTNAILRAAAGDESSGGMPSDASRDEFASAAMPPAILKAFDPDLLSREPFPENAFSEEEGTRSGESGLPSCFLDRNRSGSVSQEHWSLSAIVSGLLGHGKYAISRAAAALLIASCGGLVAMAATMVVMKSQSQYEMPTYVAKFTGAHELQWGSKDTSIMIDQLLSEGQTLEIAAGCAEITFKSGTRAVVEGPATVELRTSESVKLNDGKIAVELSPRSQTFAINTTKFSVDTPTSRVVNSGAEFGIQVDSAGNTQIDVFEGLVNVHPLASNTMALAGLPEWLSAGESLRVGIGSEADAARTVVERLTATDLRFVRTLRTKSIQFGSACIGRQHQDTATGVVIMLRDPTNRTGLAASFSFYNVHADNDRWITPIILALDRTTGVYRVTGIGQSVLNLGSGLQTVPFQLIVGSADLQAGVHTFGFYHGIVDKTGKATNPSLGPLDYDNALEPNDAFNPPITEARWLFVPAVLKHNPVELRLGLEFNLEPTSEQVQLWRGDDKHSKERVYSGQLEIVAHPQFPATTVKVQ